MLTLNYDSAIQKHLRRGEKTLWVGRPTQGWALRWQVPFIYGQFICFGLIVWWCLKLVGWIAYLNGVDLFLPAARPSQLWLLIVLVCLLVTAGQLVSDKRRRAGTWYTVTNQRLLFVLTSVWPESVIAVEYANLAEITLDPLGRVRLKLKEGDVYLANSSVLGDCYFDGMIILENNAEAREVRDLIHRQRAIVVYGADDQ